MQDSKPTGYWRENLRILGILLGLWTIVSFTSTW